jgi:hypothetical protein
MLLMYLDRELGVTGPGLPQPAGAPGERGN